MISRSDLAHERRPWDATPFHEIPKALEGLKPVRAEPWTRDDEIYQMATATSGKPNRARLMQTHMELIESDMSQYRQDYAQQRRDAATAAAAAAISEETWAALSLDDQRVLLAVDPSQASQRAATSELYASEAKTRAESLQKSPTSQRSPSPKAKASKGRSAVSTSRSDRSDRNGGGGHWGGGSVTKYNARNTERTMTPEAFALMQKSLAEKQQAAEKRAAKGRAALERKAAADKRLRPSGPTANGPVELFAFNRYSLVETKPSSKAELGFADEEDNAPRSEWIEGAIMASETAAERIEDRLNEERGRAYIAKAIAGNESRSSPTSSAIW